MISKKLIYSLTTTFFMAFAIFFKKIALTKNALPIPLLIQFTIVASIILNINLFILQKKSMRIKIRRIKMHEWKGIILGGIFLISAYIFGIYGLQLSTSINYSFILKSNLIFVIILALLFFHEKITKEKIFLIITFFSGIYLIITGGKLILPYFGDLLILLTAFLFSLFSTIQKSLVKVLGPEITSWGTISCAAFFALILSIILRIDIFSLKTILFVLPIGLMEALITLFQNKTIRIASLAYYAMMSMLLPIISIFLAFLFLNETINLIQTIGGVILITSAILVQKLRI